MNELCDTIEKVAPSPSNLLVIGESGTGKEIVARAVHETSTRASGPFVRVDVAAMPDALAERHDHLFREASGGTLFLDEIGDLPLPLQAKLLRAVETKEIVPSGDQPVIVDARIVATTHRDLATMVRDGTFRQDLLHRLQVVQLRVPALRDRKGDIPLLARDLVALHARELGKPAPHLTTDALSLLARHCWPGNVRELSNVIERAILLCGDGDVSARELPDELHDAPANDERTSCPFASADDDLERATLVFQKCHITRVLDATGGNRELAAKLLGLSSATLYRYLQKLGLKGYRAPEERRA